uniref:Uncharacterized protein n=1 Tax=Anoplophora glabripennis TaxID=217634 RepID=V5I9V1_ANOGL
MTKVSEISSSSVHDLSDIDYIKKYAKQMLRNSLFIGTFQEKRFVEPLNSYRDVITIARHEEDFINNLLVVKRKIDEGFLKKPWLGITDPDTVGAPVGYNLWVELKEEVFGKYWYKVKTVEFHENEIRLKLDIIRSVKQEHSPLRTNTNASSTQQNTDAVDFREYFNQICEALKFNLMNFCSSVLTFNNIKQSVIFLSLLIGAIITGGVGLIQYLLEYLLKLLREISFLIKAVTPIVTTCVNLVGKSIFGFYSMIVALYRSKPAPPAVYASYVQYDPRTSYYEPAMPNYRKEILYHPDTRSRSGVTITPLN